MKLIPLTQGLHAMVDDDDYDELMRWKWRAERVNRRGSWHARRKENGRIIGMHQQITGWDTTIHLDGARLDGTHLDNRRSNLREGLPATRAPGVKFCPRKECRQEKPVSEFNRNETAPDGLQTYCRDCTRIVGRESREKNPKRPLTPEEKQLRRAEGRAYYANNKQKWRKFALLKKYGLTVEAYEAMRSAQHNQCAVCHDWLGGPSPHVDHHHRTGWVRGLLCSRCNTGIGQFRDDERILAAALAYVHFGGPYFQSIGVQFERTP